jgi:hypothetical protein
MLDPATFAMVAALLVRRKQYLLNGLEDPFPSNQGASGLATVRVPCLETLDLMCNSLIKVEARRHITSNRRFISRR